jgi:quercetin dioxygenase-like cupin family protein
MDVSEGAEAGFERGDDGRFQGEVWIRGGPAAPDGTNVGVVQFAPGARTHWHRHPEGQFLYGVSGRGRVRSRGAEGHELLPGDVVFIPSEEWHYHGAARDAPLVHVAINGGGAPEWAEPVTDAEYDEGF